MKSNRFSNFVTSFFLLCIIAAGAVFYTHRASMTFLSGLTFLSSGSQLAQVASSCSSVCSGLAGYWSLDDGSGLTAADTSGNGNNGSLTTPNSPTWVAGLIGSGALSFNGSNNYVDLGSGGSLNLTGAMSISLWVKANNAAGGVQDILSKGSVGSAPSAEQYSMHLNQFGGESDAVFEISNGSSKASVASADNSISNSLWYHIVGTYDGSSVLCLYINNVMTGCHTVSGFGALNQENYSPEIGTNSYFPSQFLSGSVDDVRIYNRALSPSEVTSLYNLGNTAPAAASVVAGSSGAGGGNNGSGGGTTYTVSVSGAGSSGTVSGGSISCGSTCSQSGISPGSQIILTATPSSGYSFTSWSGCTSANGNSCTVTVNANTAVTVIFTQNQQSLGSNIYVSQNGSGTGGSCASPLSVSWLNTQTNWGTASTKIGPGDTVHLCGTISTAILILGSGSSGSPITLYFEPGTVMSTSSWPSSAISVSGQNYIVIDGGTNGLITATNSNSTSGLSSRGVSLNNVSYSEVKDLTVTNMYVRTSTSDTLNNANSSGGGGIGAYIGGNDSIDHNTISQAETGIYFGYPGGTLTSNVKIFDNTISGANHDIEVGAGNTGAIADNFQIYGNVITGPGTEWDSTADLFHHDGIYAYAEQTNAQMTNLKIYGNVLSGAWGVNNSAMIFLSDSASPGGIVNPLIYDNLLYPSDGCCNDFPIFAWVNNAGVYNNTIAGVSGANGAVRILGTGGTIENNIFYNIASSYSIQTDATNATSQTVKDNLVPAGSTIISCPPPDGSCGATFPFDSSNLKGNPLFLNAGSDYHLTSGSPAVGKGLNLSSLFTADIAGTPRPSTGPWDLGAYQYSSIPINNTPPPIITATPPVIAPVITPPVVLVATSSATPSVIPAVPITPVTPPVVPPTQASSTGPIPSPLLNIPLYTRSVSVTLLQNDLISLGYLGKGLATGYFGTLTQSAVNRYLGGEAMVTPAVSVPTVSTTLPSFTRTLSLGMSGADVKNLQIFLNTYGFTVSPSGNGSKGHETTYFGPATKSALIRFQDVYATEILKPEGLTKGTGYFGTATEREVNRII